VPYISDENFSEYIFHFSFELSVYAKNRELHFISYLFDMIRVESSKITNIHEFNELKYKKNINRAYSLFDVLCIIQNFSDTLYKLTRSKNLYFMNYIFGIINFESRNMIELYK
jgi:hypothetical protein